MLASFPTAPMSPFSSKSDKAARGPPPSCLTAQPPKLRPPSYLQTSLFIPPRRGQTCGWDMHVHTVQYVHAERATSALFFPPLCNLVPFAYLLLCPRHRSKQFLAFSWPCWSQPHCPESLFLVCI